MADAIPPPSIWRRTAPLSAIPGWSDAFPLTPIIAHLQATADAYPHAPALIGIRERLDFSELLRRVRQVGALVRRTVPRGQAIATLLPYTPSGLATMLGCLASGRITIPLNPAEPDEHLADLLHDAGAALLLTDRPPPCRLPAQTHVLSLQDSRALEGAILDPEAHDPDAPAVVLYTSGSSGRPKGVGHSSYAFLFWAFETIGGSSIAPGDRVLMGFTAASNAGLRLVLSCLVQGAALLVANAQADGIGAMLRLCATERASVIAMPTPMFGSLLAPDNSRAALANVRCVRLGSAPLSPVDHTSWRARLPRGCDIFHTYGSTEAGRIAEGAVPGDLGDAGPTVPVGRMRPGLEFAIVDEDDRPVTDGEIGELILRGRSVALGEWQAGRLTAGRMHPDPAQPGARVFRTGDLLRFGADGMLRFVGRADRQIKINGVRVEPAEIEAVIRADAAVRDAAVVPGASGELDAFVAAPGADPERLRAALIARMRAALPSALRPRRISVLAELPTLPGGKLDIVTLRRWAEQPEDRHG